MFINSTIYRKKKDVVPVCISELLRVFRNIVYCNRNDVPVYTYNSNAGIESKRAAFV